MNNINKLYLFSIIAILFAGAASPAFAVHEHDPSTTGATALILTNSGTGEVELQTTNSPIRLDSNLGDGTIMIETQTAGVSISAGADATDPTDGDVEIRSTAATEILPAGALTMTAGAASVWSTTQVLIFYL